MIEKFKQYAEFNHRVWLCDKREVVNKLLENAPMYFDDLFHMSSWNDVAVLTNGRGFLYAHTDSEKCILWKKETFKKEDVSEDFFHNRFFCHLVCENATDVLDFLSPPDVRRFSVNIPYAEEDGEIITKAASYGYVVSKICVDMHVQGAILPAPDDNIRVLDDEYQALIPQKAVPLNPERFEEVYFGIFDGGEVRFVIPMIIRLLDGGQVKSGSMSLDRDLFWDDQPTPEVIHAIYHAATNYCNKNGLIFKNIVTDLAKTNNNYDNFEYASAAGLVPTRKYIWFQKKK